jgi:hypothetical protein
MGRCNCRSATGVDSDARNRLMGHRPADVKALSYQVTQVRYLFDPISKLAPLLDLSEGVNKSDKP